MFMRFLTDKSGATALEFGLIATCMALTFIAGVVAVGDQTGVLFASNTK